MGEEPRGPILPNYARIRLRREFSPRCASARRIGRLPGAPFVLYEWAPNSPPSPRRCHTKPDHQGPAPIRRRLLLGGGGRLRSSLWPHPLAPAPPMNEIILSKPANGLILARPCVGPATVSGGPTTRSSIVSENRPMEKPNAPYAP